MTVWTNSSRFSGPLVRAARKAVGGRLAAPERCARQARLLAARLQTAAGAAGLIKHFGYKQGFLFNSFVFTLFLLYLVTVKY